MTDISQGKSTREVEKQEARRNNFFSQTNEENAARVEANVVTLQDVKNEIKFIESILLAQFGDPDV